MRSKLNHNHSSTLRYVANTFFVFPVMLFITACATITPLPEPADKANSLLIVGLRVEFESVLMNQVTYASGRLFLRRADEPGTPGLSQTQIVSNYPNGQYFLFANVPPGTYQIDRFAKILEAEVNPNHPDYNLVFTFSPNVVNGTTVRVSPRSVVYVGDFTVRYKQRIVPPPQMVRYEVAETSGNRSEKGKAQAIETLQKHYGSSPWAAYAIAP